MESQAKSLYISHCERNDSVPIFAQPWYLDISCLKSWDVAMQNTKKGVSTFIPYYIKKRLAGLSTIGQAPLTPFSYVINVIADPKKADIAMQGDISKTLQEFPKTLFTRLHLNPSIVNGLPFYQAGYDISTRYTYEIKDTKNHQKIWDALNPSVRNHIKKNEDALKVEESEDIEKFIDLLKEVFQRQNQDLPFSAKILQGLNQELQNQDRRKMLFVCDEKNEVLAGVYLIFDANHCYCLLTGTRASARNLHPLSTLYWEAIKYSSKSSDRFNFLGSMIPNIERMFRSFSGVQVPYISAIKASGFIKTLKGV